MGWVTILTPIFNGVEYFEECYNSILRQTEHDWKWIIGVNGHGDETNEIYILLKNKIQDSRISIVNYLTIGKVNTLNEMVKEVTTEYIALCDCDDSWFTDKLKIQKEILHTYPMIDILGTNLQYIGELNHIPNFPFGKITLDILFTINPIVNSSVIMKTNIAIWKNDYFGVEDYDLWFRSCLEEKNLYTIQTPLIYHRVYNDSYFNNSGKQQIDLLLDHYKKQCEVTVVTGYFPIKSKFPINEYLEWLKFWKDLPCKLVIFTVEELVPMFESLRFSQLNYTKIIPMKLENLEAFKTYGTDFWIEQKLQDHEQYHTPELYAIWYEKKEFIKKAIEFDFFKSKKYVWCDAGICRNVNWIPITKSFPISSKIPDDKFLVLRITNFEKKLDLKYINCVGGGILAASKEYWLKFIEQYDIVLKEFVNDNKFVGKDQTIIANMYLKDPNFFLLFPILPNLDGFTSWFSLLFYLSS